jgi:hypothetical protein
MTAEGENLPDSEKVDPLFRIPWLATESLSPLPERAQKFPSSMMISGEGVTVSLDWIRAENARRGRWNQTSSAPENRYAVSNAAVCGPSEPCVQLN